MLSTLVLLTLASSRTAGRVAADRCAALKAIIHSDGEHGRYAEALAQSLKPQPAPVLAVYDNSRMRHAFVSASDACGDDTFHVVDLATIKSMETVLIVEVVAIKGGYSFSAYLGVPNIPPSPTPGLTYGVGVLAGDTTGTARKMGGTWVAKTNN